MAIKVSVSTRVAKGLKNKVKKDIIESIEGSPTMRKEIRRVFQMANRRIQNIEKSGVFSPAVAALGKGDVKGYSKFSVSGFGNTGNDWKSLKKEYAKAISFLNQPTSSAAGAREFEQQVKQQMNIDDDLWKAIREQVIGGYNKVESQLLLALPYSEFMQEVYSRTSKDSSTQMEEEAKYIAEELQQNIDSTAEEVANAYETLINGFKL
ncbi:MAG: hypothetical protein ACI37T_02005 [Candidatus Gastranaerophilaceae bacterium]